MKFVLIHPSRVVLGYALYHQKDLLDDNWFFKGTDTPESAARNFVESIEDEVCVAFLEALSLQAQKAINRHADFCFKNYRWEDKPDKDIPEWATKYKDAGI